MNITQKCTSKIFIEHVMTYTKHAGELMSVEYLGDTIKHAVSSHYHSNRTFMSK